MSYRDKVYGPDAKFRENLLQERLDTIFKLMGEQEGSKMLEIKTVTMADKLLQSNLSKLHLVIGEAYLAEVKDIIADHKLYIDEIEAQED